MPATPTGSPAREGEEEHLEGLAAAYDAKIEEMRGTFGEIGDMRLHVMAAITMADELHEAKKRIAALEAEVAALNSVNAARDERIERIETRLAEGIQMAADASRGWRAASTRRGRGKPCVIPGRSVAKGTGSGASLFAVRLPGLRLPGKTPQIVHRKDWLSPKLSPSPGVPIPT